MSKCNNSDGNREETPGNSVIVTAGEDEEEEWHIASTASFIPELPIGRQLQLIFHDNWGDPKYVGINGLQVFASNGQLVQIREVSQINDDNTNCLNGHVGEVCCRIRWDISDHHARNEDPIVLKVEFEAEEQVAMIRIWNYHNSRLDSICGVRTLCMKLDGIQIFYGEINCAYYNNNSQDLGDTILFTTDDKILELICQNDTCILHHLQSASLGDEERNDDSSCLECLTSLPALSRPTTGAETAPVIRRSLSSSGGQHCQHLLHSRKETSLSRPGTGNCAELETTVPTMKHATVYQVVTIRIELLSNWGGTGYIGLTGLQLIRRHGGMPIEPAGVSVVPTVPDTNPSPLFNGQNLTRDPASMWLTKWEIDKPISITITANGAFDLQSIAFWNYNASAELSYCGVRTVNIYVNQRPALMGVVLRKAPGYVYFDFVQDIHLDLDSFSISKQQSLSSIRPYTHSISGFIYEVRLMTTWGDEFYVGLNGIEMFDNKDRRLHLRQHNLAAFPESVNVLPSVDKDPRVSSNLIDGVNDTTSAKHMWLTPQLPNRLVRIFFIFDVITVVSKIVLYNYRKTPERGARHFSISVDDLIICEDEIPKSSTKRTGMLTVMLREI